MKTNRPTWLEKPLGGMDRIYRWPRDPRDQGGRDHLFTALNTPLTPTKEREFT